MSLFTSILALKCPLSVNNLYTAAIRRGEIIFVQQPEFLPKAGRAVSKRHLWKEVNTVILEKGHDNGLARVQFR